MTFNVYMDGHLDAPSALQSCQAIAESGADLVCLQESNPHWERLLLADKKIKDTYPFHKFFHDRWKHGGRAFFSKYNIDEFQEDSDFSQRIFFGWYAAWKVRIRINHEFVLHVINVHLRAPFPSNPFIVMEQRRHEIEAHFRNLAVSSEPMLILGDFNTPSGAPIDWLLNEKGLKNAVYEAFPNRRARPITWHLKSLWGIGRLYDHVFFSEDFLRVQEVSCPRIGGSDHWPLVCTFSIHP